MRTGQLAFAAAVIMSGVACNDAETRRVDSATATDTAGVTRSVEDTTTRDSVATYPGRDTARAPANDDDALPPVIGETRRRGSTISPRDPPPRDPPPFVTGETRRPGGAFGTPNRPRDSVIGPKISIDESGRVSPIKR